MKAVLFPLILGLSVTTLPVHLVVAVDFQEEIRPILNSKCFKCHSGPRAKGKLRMDSNEDLAERIGGDDPAIVPGKSASSLLVIKASLPRDDGDAMPPPPARARGAEAMTSVELRLVKEWIDAGASLEKSEDSDTSTTDDAPTAMESEMLEWTNFEGNSLTAAFVRAEGTNVILRLEDGKEIPYPFEKLGTESQEVARKLATAP